MLSAPDDFKQVDMFLWIRHGTGWILELNTV